MQLFGFFLWHQMADAGRARPLGPERPAQPALRIPTPLWCGLLTGSLGVGPLALFTLAHAYTPLPAPAIWFELIAAALAMVTVHATLSSRLRARTMVTTVPVFVMVHFLALFTTACLHGCG